MVDSGAADDFRDVRDILKTLGIDWRTAEHLTRFNALAEQSLFAINQVVGAFALADTPHALPESTVGTWLSLLLQTAVETVLFPDRLPKGTRQWEDLAAIWDDYIANVRKFHLTGVRAFSAAEVWSVRGAVRAAWNIELSAVGERTEIGAAIADSAHRAALLAGERLWMDFKEYGEEASDHPDKRAAMWDAFLAKWPSDKLHRQSERTKATLTHELARLRERLGFAPAPSAGAQAVAVAQASIGNVVVHNHIVLPDAGRAHVAPTAPGPSPATAPTQAPAPAPAAEDAGEQCPALTLAEQVTLRALASFDPSILASVRQIVEAMDPDEAVSERTVTPALRKLVELDLAERPEGERRGTRLTLKGRRLAAKMPKIAD